VAGALHDVDLGTLTFDLLAPSEATDAGFNARLRSDVGLLARRLGHATHWARLQPETAELLIGYFGASTSVGAVLAAAAAEGPSISAVVTRGGRVGLPVEMLKKLHSPTLLIVGGNHRAVVTENLEAWAQLTCEKSLEIIPGAGALFEEPGALDNVAALTARWFGEHLKRDLVL
jgi:putative phosphoribosyl transferase